MASTDELATLDFERSNKGASKQRRDQINAEISLIRDLLPLPESSRQRLSQLQIMSLTCVYIRKCNLLQKLFRLETQEPELPECLDFFQALTGFLLVATKEGKLVYISENVTDYLGHSMVDMKTQGDSLYDIVDRRDHGRVQAQLLQAGHDHEVAIVCRMNMSRTLKRQPGFGDVKVMHIRGHFMNLDSMEPGCHGESVLMATCSPVITPDMRENTVQNNTMVFKTVHKLDMTFLAVSSSGEYHFGCGAADLTQKSWYSTIHPEDIIKAKEKHSELIHSNQELGLTLTVRMLRPEGNFFWVNIVMHMHRSVPEDDEPLIVCINQVIHAHEAYQMRVQGDLFSMYSSHMQEPWDKNVPFVPIPDNKTGHWLPQHLTNAISDSKFPVNIPNYIERAECSVTHPTFCSSNVRADSKPVGGCPVKMSNKFVPQDQLKAMLKRKIQGPQANSYTPSKMAKPSWNSESTNGGSERLKGQLIYHEEQFSQDLFSSHVECQSQMRHTNNTGALVSANKTTLRHQTSQNLVKSSSVICEHVVPESYLTPDPSPVSSPQPPHFRVKNEVMDPKEKCTQGKSSVNILQALERLAAHPFVKKEKELKAEKEKELPVIDVFYIEQFFESLTGDLKTSDEMGARSKEIKIEQPAEKVFSFNIPNFAALKQDNVIVTPCPENSSCINSDDDILCSIHTLSSTQTQLQKKPLFQIQPPVQISQVQIQEKLMAQHPYVSGSPEELFHCSNVPSVESEKNNQTSMHLPDAVVSLPESYASSKTISDLLNFLSEERLDQTKHDTSTRSLNSEDLLNIQSEETCLQSFYVENSHYPKTLQTGVFHQAEDFSPQSSTSSLEDSSTSSLEDSSTSSLEDELFDETPDFSMEMELALNSFDIKCFTKSSSVIGQETRGMSDDHKMDFILESWMPLLDSQDILKHGQ